MHISSESVTRDVKFSPVCVSCVLFLYEVPAFYESSNSGAELEQHIHEKNTRA